MTLGRIAVLTVCALLSAPARAETIQITIDKLVFAPVEVNAKVGDAVEWVNKDVLAHTATATATATGMSSRGRSKAVMSW